ncbi:MAG: SDR family oxidoreductase [Acidobacteriota bacterium]
MLLITGPTGNTGREVVARLHSTDHPFRVLTRRPEAARQLEAQGLDVVLGDFDRPETLPAALEGVHRAFLVCTPDPKMVERETGFIDAARAAGVERVVKISALGADAASDSPNLRFHAAIEDHLRASGLDYTILRPHAFMQTMFWMCLPTIHEHGIVSGPAGDGAAAHIDLRDVAAVAVSALTTDEHARSAYDLTGPEAVTMAQIADLFAPLVGKPLAYVPSPEEPVAMAMRAMGVPETSVEHVLVVFRKIRDGQLADVTDTLRTLGIEPGTWQGFVDDVAAGRTGAATSFEPPGAPPAAG